MIRNLGGVGVSVADVYGNFVGAFYSLSGVPQKWREKVVYGPFIATLASELVTLSHCIASQKQYIMPSTVSGLFELLTLVESGYKAIYNKFSPGPGDPCVWPGGYKTIEEMDAHINQMVRQPFEELAAKLTLESSPAAQSILGGVLMQLTEDRNKMLAAFTRRPAVNGLLAQIKLKAKQ